MKNRFFISLLLLLSLFVTGCANMSQSDINDKCSSGVVLIRKMSYFELVLPNGEKFYFSSFDKEKNQFEGLVANKEEVKMAESYGTGFFVSKYGHIATNNHVVSTDVKKEETEQALAQILYTYKEQIIEQYRGLNEYYQQLDNSIQEKYYNDEDYSQEQQELYNVQQQKQQLEIVYNEINNINVHNTKLNYYSELGISYNNSFGNIEKCSVIATDETHDLAIIQLNNKQTPQQNYVFNIDNDDPLTTYSFVDNVKKKMGNDKNNNIFMIGFNLGPNLAITKEGVKSQINSGHISQQTNERLLYSIPALQGSSGSPVVNENAEVVAVNFAGLNFTQSFNYGIRIKFLKQLINSLNLP